MSCLIIMPKTRKYFFSFYSQVKMYILYFHGQAKGGASGLVFFCPSGEKNQFVQTAQ